MTAVPYDYTNAPPPREFDLIPAPTVATTQIQVLRGGVGEDALLTRTEKGDCEMLKIEFTVVDGSYAHRKWWQNFVLEGVTPGHATAVEISRRTLRATIESARGIMPDDVSPEARVARTAALKDFDNLIFIAKIGIEKGKPKNNGSGDSWPDKNVLIGVITPDKKDWHPVTQPAPNGGGGGSTAAAAPAAPTAPAAPAPGIAKPSWAT